MNYYRFPNKFEYTTNHLISTPASSSTMKLASMRHEKSTSLLKLPPIKTSKALLPQPKAMLLPENYKNISDGKEFNDYARESSNSPIKRILLHKKMGSKENRSVEPHQRNLKESNGLLSDSSLNDMKLSKSPLNEHKTNYSLEHMTNKTPKSEQTHLPKMQNKRLEGMSDLKIGSFPNFSEENHRNNSLLTSVKHKEHFQFFFNPSILLSEQLLDKNDLPKLEFSKCSSKKNGVIKAYSANTHQGLIRNYNEDRVAIILNIIKPANKKIQEWPSCSFFAIYDGHGGSKCAEFLRDNLHHYVIFSLRNFKDKIYFN